MADGDITDTLVDQLSIRLEDEDLNNPKCDEDTKLDYLTKAQVFVATMLHKAYLTEFESEKTGVDVSSGSVAFSALNSGGILHGKEGIINVEIKPGGTNGKWAIEIDFRDIKNNSISYSDTQPLYYVWNEEVHVLVTTLTATKADFYFLAIPSDLAKDVDPVINKSLYEIVLDVAEAMFWRMDKKPDREARAMESAYNQLKILNAKYEPAQGFRKDKG